jgi:hypothetical protein
MAEVYVVEEVEAQQNLAQHIDLEPSSQGPSSGCHAIRLQQQSLVQIHGLETKQSGVRVPQWFLF